MPSIEITIAKDGETKVEAFGFQGGKCVEATKPIRDGIVGEAPKESVKKPEFNIPDLAQAQGIKIGQ